MSRIRQITFDVNKTLIKVRGSPGEHYRMIAEKHGVPASTADLDEVFKQVWNSHWARHPNFGCEDNSITSKDWWSQVVQQVFLKCGYKGNYSQLTSIASDSYNFFYEPEAWSIFPETVDVLRKLKEMDFKLGIISNFDKRLCTILDNLDLSQYFNFITTSEKSRSCKPNPRIFHVALSKSSYRFPMNECLHVGNSVQRDYLPAKTLGMNAALVYRGDMTSLPKKLDPVEKKDLIHDLNGLISIVQ